MCRFKQTRVRNPGFTLAELVAILAALCVLILAVVPALCRTRPGNELIRCSNNLQQLQRAQAMYAADNGGWLVQNLGLSAPGYTNWAAGWMDFTMSSANTNVDALLKSALGPYAGRAEIYKCPADLSVAVNGPRVRSYSMNGFVGGTMNWSMYPGYQYRAYLKESELAVPGPSRIWALVDEDPASINDSLFSVRMPPAASWPGSAVWVDIPAMYHSEGANLSFMDGRVELRTWDNLSSADNRWLVERSSVPR